MALPQIKQTFSTRLQYNPRGSDYLFSRSLDTGKPAGGGGAAGGLGKTAENEEKSRREQEPFEHLLYSVHHVGQIHPVSGWLSIA